METPFPHLCPSVFALSMALHLEHPFPNLCLAVHPVLRSFILSARNPLNRAFVRVKFEERA